MTLTQEKLKQVLDYDALTGEFIWKDRNDFRIKTGHIAGHVGKLGYRAITIKKKGYRAHRLAWLYVYGQWPNGLIDHINGNKLDNRIENLRDVTTRENGHNTYKHRSGKMVGADFHKRTGKWRARIEIEGKIKHLGLFSSEIEAHKTYLHFLNEFLKRENNDRY